MLNNLKTLTIAFICFLLGFCLVSGDLYPAPLRHKGRTVKMDPRAKAKIEAVARQSSVAIIEANGFQYGSGVLVSPRYVVTARHVTAGAKTVEMDINGVILWGDVIFEGDKWDLAVIKLRRSVGNSYLTLDLTATDESRKAFIFSKGDFYQGYISSKRLKDGAFHYSIYTEPGFSGSGVFDEDGELIGIHVKKRTRRINTEGEAVSISKLTRKLRSVIIKE